MFLSTPLNHEFKALEFRTASASSVVVHSSSGFSSAVSTPCASFILGCSQPL
ncbi:hypothetical protein A2U01_0113579, partial [Trifolium medium]|nr:hypothetical protein [Trifolium medium]